MNSKKILDTLPDKPSELIRLALHDLELIEKKDDWYEIGMAAWYDRNTVNGKCSVCFAGAVMAMSLFKNELQADLRQTPSDFVESIECKLVALNCLRRGLIKGAFIELDLEMTARLPDNFPIVPYSENPALFKSRMAELADLLDAQGF